jgi:phenylacetate-CoA ligase
MLIIRGVNVFPSEIERALLAIPELAPHYQVLVERPGHLDELTVQAELRPGEDGGERLHAFVEERLGRALGINARVQLGAPGAIPRSEGKALRVVDRRAG